MGPAERKAKIAGLVRLARRAGRTIVGVQLTNAAVRSGRASAVLVADDLSSSRRDRLIERWRAAGVALHTGWTKDELGELAGKPAVAVLSIADRDIAAGMAALEPRDTEEREE